MKKVLIALIIGLLLCGYSVAARAGVAVSVDTLLAGEYQADEGDDFDASLTTVNIDWLFNRWKFGAELGTGEIKRLDDLNLTKLKVGYRVIQNEGLYLDLVASQVALDVGDVFDIDGTMLGADLYCRFSEKTSLELAAGFAVDADFTEYGSKYDKADIIEYKLKFNYIFNNNVSLGAGYRGYNFDIDGYDDKLVGYILGVDLRF